MKQSRSPSHQNTNSKPPSLTSNKQPKTINNQVTTKQSKNLSNHTSAKGANHKKQQPTLLYSISPDNYDIIDQKFNITDITSLQIKYVLKCIGGIYKNRFLYITTHKQGQIIGAGDAKQYGLTLQVEGAGLSEKHVKLKFNGLKKFYVKDYHSQSGTWMTVPKDGIQIKHGDVYLVGALRLRFELGNHVNQIEELCILYDCNDLADVLIHNRINDLPSLYRAEYEKFKGYPFSEKMLHKLYYMCNESKNWFNEQKQYRNINMYYQNEQIFSISQEIGWKPKKIYSRLQDSLVGDFLYQNNNPSQEQNLIQEGENKQSKQNYYEAQVIRGRLIPKDKIFSKIIPQKSYQLQLHDQIRIGELSFELTRFNVGVGEDIGSRQIMEDGLIVEQDVGGSQWKLISLFGVIDGYGGPECVDFIKKNLIKKVRQWTPLLDEAGDLNSMLKLLMNKTLYEIDYEFHKMYGDLSLTCGATMVLMMVIESKVYVFNLGDSKGYLYRDEKIYQMTIDHIPSRADEKMRIQQAGGIVQYNRLMGKCTLSRALGQFQYKDQEDYEKGMKGKLKSFLSCSSEVKCFDIKPQLDQFILLTTDGLIETLDIKTVCNYILQKAGKLQSEQNPDKIVSSLMENCKLTNSNADNMGIILIFLKKGKIGSKISF